MGSPKNPYWARHYLSYTSIISRKVCWSHHWHVCRRYGYLLLWLRRRNYLAGFREWSKQCWTTVSKQYRLVLNQSETKWMLFGTRQKLEHCSDHTIQLHWEEIDRVSSFCYLGVTLDKNLSWNEHVRVELVWKKVSKRLGLLSRIRPYFTLKAAKYVYNCLVQPIFRYSETVWGWLSIGCSDSFQRLQYRAAHIIQRRAMAEESFKRQDKTKQRHSSTEP